MTIQEPAWLKRTRPCPFFSQGRCLFADSCNFLHDVQVRSAVGQPLRSTIHVKRPSLTPKPVFHPPSVVVNSASPRSDSLASPQNPMGSIQDSSRYSGLLSVLSDVIGPCNSLAAAEGAVPASRAMSTIPSTIQGTARDRTDFRLESNPFESISVAELETWQGAPSRAEPPSFPELDSEATLVDPFGHQMKSFFPEADSEPVAEFHPVPDNEQSGVGDTIPYFVEASEGYVIGAGAEEDAGDMDDRGEEDLTVVLSHRRSTLSSFTGASLLASPHSLFGEPSVVSPVEDGAVDLLSPVQLSAKLRPFPIPASGSKIKRGDSIDSGYADGESWVSPLPFPRSPPRSFRSPVTFMSHSRRTSLSSLSLRAKRVSYDVTALRPSLYNRIEVIKEVEPDGGPEGNEDTAYTILSAYHALPSEEQGEGGFPLQVNVAEEKAEEGDKPSEAPAVIRSLPRYSPENLHPAREYGLDPCNQPSFISDDNLSFKTALSTQPSYEDLSDISRVSPIKQDSLLSYISGCSTPNTSVLSHYGDADEFLEQSIVDSHAYESYVVGQVDGTKPPEARASKECPPLEGVAVNSSVPSAPASTGGLASVKAVAPRGFLSASDPSMDTSHDPSSTTDVLGHIPLDVNDLWNSVPRRALAPQDRSPGVFHFDKQHPGVCEHLEFTSANFVVPRERLPSILDRDQCSPRSSLSMDSDSPSERKDVPGRAPAGASDVQKLAPQKRLSGALYFEKRSLGQGSLAESPRNLSPVKDTLGSVPQDANGMLDRLLANAATPEHLSGDFHFDKPVPRSSSSGESPPSYPDPSDTRDVVPENVVALQERMSGVLHLARPSPNSYPFAESAHNPSTVEDISECAPSGASSNNFRSTEALPTVLNGCLAVCAVAEAHQSLVENSLGSDEVSEIFETEHDSFTQCLSFPLPPPFLPMELAGHSTLSGEAEDTSVLSEGIAANLEENVENAYAVFQDEETERIYSCSDLTEKARPSQLPLARSPDSNVDFTLRRNRAASDLTVKAGSPPVTIPRETPNISNSPPSSLEQPRSDCVQSLYDQYFDDHTLDNGSESSSPAHKDVTHSDVSGHAEEPPQENYFQSPDLIPYVLQRVSTSTSDSVPGTSGTDSPLSETVLRPLLTGRRSFLRPSLAEIIPKADLANNNESSSSSLPPTRLQAREVGSTMVPLGFRRHRFRPATTHSSQPLHTVLPTSQLREVLRIRTDVARDDSSPGCSSATNVSFVTWSPLPEKAMSAPPTSGLRQLRLSSIINKRSSILSTHSSSIASSILSSDQLFNLSTPQSPSVSPTSFSHSSSLSSSCAQIPEHTHHTLKRSSSNSLVQQVNDNAYFTLQPLTRRNSRSVSTPTQHPKSWRLSHYRAGSRNYTPANGARRISRTSTLSLPYAVDEEHEVNEDDTTKSRSMQSIYADDWTCSASILATPVHAIATPKPNLLFAIASDDVDQVRRVLENGEAGPNDSVGPQSALAFTLTNDKLAHKQEIVKALLAYGANPAALRNPTLNPAPRMEEGNEPSGPPPETTLEGMDPATRYFVARADAAHTRQTSQLIYRSFFRPLTRVRYDVIGQDWALEQLFRVLSMHSQKLAVAPIVVLLCGPSGHGKSLLARKFAYLLDVPTHTVNMTTVRSAHDIWQSYSMSPYEEPPPCTLAEFLIENEGKRCVVVLDEIEKVEDQKALWPLLMPWELGQCSLEAGKRHVDARNVIWLGTSNIGHELVFEYHESRAEPDKRMSREDYLELTAMLRPHVSRCLGASLVSRVTTVLPFVPFTMDEKKAIAAEAIFVLAGDASRTLSPQDVESLVTKALPSYHPSEGARSLHRAISNILVDTI